MTEAGLALEPRPSARATESRAKIDLRVAGLAKSFGAVPVLRGVSFDVRQRQAVALLGANGAGKSTLLRCCVRLIEADEGEIEVLGRSVRGLAARPLRRLRGEVGFVFQRHNLVPRLNALSNVGHGRLGRGHLPPPWFQVMAPTSVRAAAMEKLAEVGLAHLAFQRADRLSGGQSQRVAIARALIQEPRLILADEPVASLDPNAGEEVMELFVRLVRDRGATFLFSSHHLEHALRYADRVIALDRGKIVLDEASADLTTRDLRRLYA